MHYTFLYYLDLNFTVTFLLLILTDLSKKIQIQNNSYKQVHFPLLTCSKCLTIMSFLEEIIQILNFIILMEEFINWKIFDYLNYCLINMSKNYLKSIVN